MSRLRPHSPSSENRTAWEPRGSGRTHPRTNRSWRSAATLAAVFLALLLSACGVNAVDKSAPEPVTNVTTTPGVGLITVEWEDNSTFETGFVVSRKTVDATTPATALPDQESDEAGWSVLATVDADITTYEDRDVKLATEYRYSVTATNDGTASDAVEPDAPEPVEVLNGAPVADAQVVTVSEDASVGITLSGSDFEESALAYTVVTAPAHGSLEGTAPALVYTPTPDFHGSDAFTFRVNDGNDDSAVATVSIEVQPENDAPVADPQSLSVDEDHTLGIELTGSDTEASELTFSIEAGPVHGELTGEGSAWTYTPDENYNGTDAFSFTASDGQTTSTPADVSIEIVAQPDAPTFTSTPVVQVDEDEAYAYSLSASDADNNSLEFSANILPDWLELTDHGDGTATLASVAGRPSNDDVGSDHDVELSLHDGTGLSASQSFAVKVSNINDAPVIDQGERADITVEEEAVSAPLDLTATDVDAGAVLVWSIALAPSHGTVDLGEEGTVTYAGDDDYFGFDAFVIEVSDGSATAAIVVDVEVTNVQDLPIAIDDAFTTAEDTRLEGNVLTNVDNDGSYDYDPDNDPIHVVDSDLTHAGVDPVSGPSHGSLALNANGTFAYVPVEHYFGTDSFVYAIRDDNSGENVLATVTIDVTPVDDAPVIAQGDSASIIVAEEAKSSPLSLSASDVEGDALSWSLDSQAQHGTASVDSSGAVTYTGHVDYAGEDAFVVAVSANGVKDTITISVTVENVNDAPVIDQGETGSITTDEDITSAPLALSVTDVDAGDKHVWTIGNDAAHGTASVDGSGNVTYLGDDNYNGGDSFTVVVTDGGHVQDEISIDVNVAPVADAPTVVDDTGATRYDEVLMMVEDASSGTTSSLLTNDSDVDGDPFNVIRFDTSSHMGASVNVVASGQFSYDPRGVAALAESGIHADTFQYTVVDETGLRTTGTVTVHVGGNSAPIGLTLAPSSVPENESAGKLVGTFSTTDPDPEDTHTYSLVAGLGDEDNGSFTISDTSLVTNATFDYEARSMYSIRVRVDDGRGGTYEEAVTVTVGDVLECPAFPTETRGIDFDGSAPYSNALDLGGAYEFTLPESTSVHFQFSSFAADFNITLVKSDGCALYTYDAQAGGGYMTGFTIPSGANAIILTPADGQSGTADISLTPN